MFTASDFTAYNSSNYFKEDHYYFGFFSLLVKKIIAVSSLGTAYVSFQIIYLYNIAVNLLPLQRNIFKILVVLITVLPFHSN